MKKKNLGTTIPIILPFMVVFDTIPGRAVVTHPKTDETTFTITIAERSSTTLYHTILTYYSSTSALMAFA